MTREYGEDALSSGRRSVGLLIDYLVEQARRRFRGAASIAIQGSASRDEYTVYSDRGQDILLGNVGLHIITAARTADTVRYLAFRRFLRHIDRSDFGNSLRRPLTLVKPFEVTLIPLSALRQGRIPADIWAFEAVNANRVVHGRNLLHLFNTDFGPEAGLRMILARLFGLNLCLPLILRNRFASRLETLVVNYESVKGILGALEALATLEGEYLPTYSERAHLADGLAETFAGELRNPEKIAALFKQASQLKLHPQGLEELPTRELWFMARDVLADCLSIYRARGHALETLPARQGGSVRDFSHFASRGHLAPRALFHNPDTTAIRQMRHAMFAAKSDGEELSPELIRELISGCRRANLLRTRGEWQEITDHIKVIRPGQSPQPRTV